MGTKLTEGFKAAGKEHGFDLVVTGEPALFYLRIANDDSLMLHQEWVSECVSRGPVPRVTPQPLYECRRYRRGHQKVHRDS